MAGYEGSTDEEAVEALAAEAFGMSTVSYLRSCAPALMPSLEEMQAEYDGSGTDETAEGMLIRQFDAEGMARTKTERYIREDIRLILSEGTDTDVSGFIYEDYPILYTLEESQ